MIQLVNMTFKERMDKKQMDENYMETIIQVKI